MPHDYPMLINGKLEQGDENFSVLNPATALEICTAPIASPLQIERTAQAAHAAFVSWGLASNQNLRREKLLACQNALKAHQDELAELLTLEQGKPLAAALSEVSSAIDEMSITLSYPIFHQVLQNDDTKKVEMRQIPFGVVVAITPWNYPVYIALAKMTAALWSGNTLILKPSEYTPLTSLRIGAILQQNLPPGVFNVLSGHGDVGQLLIEHPRVKKVSFTGSVATGKRIAQACAPELKRMTLELGGNDAAIVLEDAPIKPFAPAIFWGAFVNSGQICVAIKRLFIHRSKVRKWAQALYEIAQSIVIGNGMDPATQMGPINNAMQFEKLKNYYQQAVDSGCTVWGDGPQAGAGYFFKPTLVTDILSGHPLVDEEQFGPLLPIIAYDDIDQAIEQANAVNLGLAGSVWGSDTEQAYAIAQRLHTGTVWINTIHDSHQDACFGGVKHSGIGREGGPEGLKSFGEIKVITQSKI